MPGDGIYVYKLLSRAYFQQLRQRQRGSFSWSYALGGFQYSDAVYYECNIRNVRSCMVAALRRYFDGDAFFVGAQKVLEKVGIAGEDGRSVKAWGP